MRQTEGAPETQETNNNAGQENSNPENALKYESNAPTISAPKGGGAIASIGEKYQANPVTGTGGMTVPIALSPGRNDFTPQLAFSYDSGSGNSEFGLGWNVGIPSITRKTQKGLPKYHDSSESDIFLLAGAEDLIPKLEEDNGDWNEIETTANGYTIKQYRPRIEGLFAKIEKHTNNSDSSIVFWKVTTKDNMTSVYGRSSSARVFDAANSEKVFQWMLEYTYDDKGNIIWYQFKRENSDNHPATLSEKNRSNDALTNLYLKTVKYSPNTMYSPASGVPHDPSTDSYFGPGTDWHFQVVFDYGEHNNDTIAEDTPWSVRQDPFSTYRAGFEIRTYRLCRRVLMFHHFETELGVDPYLVKSTDLTFNENGVATKVSSIKHVCYASGETPAEYPPVSFTYSEATIDSNIHQHNIEDMENLPGGVGGNGYRWADLHGEGLSGVLIDAPQAWYYKRNLGDENYYKDLPANQTPTPEARLGSVAEVIERPSLAGTQGLGDLDGDGRPDLSVYGNGVNGYYALDEEGKWKNFIPFESNPNVDWNDPNLRRVDVDGDGFADLLITKDNCFMVYPSLAEKGFAPSYETLQSFDEETGPKVVFSDADQSIHLADMSGDGLTDIVRIQNGAVCYWPNLGHGRFGKKITLDNSPTFDNPDIFNQSRIRLGDVDGSGTTDILYINDEDVRYYPNESGNRLADAVVINAHLPTHTLANISLLDILGNGTSCLVWSSPVPGDQPPALKFIDLMGGIKPYLLTEVNNNMGSISRMKYAPSTKFYLRDERNGTPWITKLPFPVQVVERVEIWDEVNRNRFVSKYAYHHGYFDGVEREFRGFGMVEQWDTEDFTDFIGEGLFPPGYNATEEVLHAAPIHTKSWFHLGFHDQSERILGHYESEYFAGDSNAFSLSKTVTISDTSGNPISLEGQTLREATRSLKGRLLRQEVYSADGSPEADVPYTVNESSYDLVLQQPRGASDRRDRDYASFLLIPAESLAYQYERNTADPRVAHQLTLETDAYGHPLKAASVVYPRRSSESIGYSQQETLKITVQETSLVNEDDSSVFYRLGVPTQAKSYEVTGITYANALLDPGTLLSDFDGASEISFETAPSSGIEKRLLDHSRILYYDETLTTTPLAFGSIASHAIPYETYQLALTAGQVTNVLNENFARVDTNLLTAGKYVDHLSDGDYWVPSGRAEFDTANFFVPTKQIDPYGNETTMDFDDNYLVVDKTTDALGNEASATYDYRILQPEEVTDPNGNRQQFAFDVRGMVTKVAVMGKITQSLGDDLTDPTSEFSYDLFNWMNNQEPNWAYSKAREVHGAGNTRFIESYAYSDGLGQVVMTKSKAADGLAYGRDGNGDLLREPDDSLSDPIQTSPRWLGNGRTILDNKGNPVKQYEPYFSSTHEYETEAELVEYGVTPVIYYDPLGRAVRTEMPDDTLTKVEFTPWEQKSYDQNDTVKGSLWYSSRNSPDPDVDPEPTDRDERAAWLAAKHDSTPQVIHLDNLARPFVTIDHNKNADGSDDLITMVTELDIKGNPLSITDAKGRTSFTYTYGVLNQPLKTTHIDNGTRYALADAVGNPLRAWDDRSQQFRFTYDELLRPKGTYLTPDYDGTPGSEQLLQLTVFGEEATNPADNNLLGQAHIIFDSAGMVKNPSFDFKGNPLSTERQLAQTYQTSPDWISLDGYTSVANLLSSAAGLLETEVFTQSTAYDALNRPTSMIKPDSSEMLPGYDDGGQLETMDIKLRGAGTATNFVSAITYNERGQRNYITYGNGSHTTYHYDEKTFRLTRLITTKNAGADIIQDLNYTYDPAGNIVEQVDDAQQTHFFNNTEVSPNGKYEYDPLYRLLKAEGRELIGLSAPSESDIAINQLPDNTTALERYTQSYEYDELGNIEKMIHSATSGSWTKHYHYNAGFTNNLLLSRSNDGTQGANDYTYDTHGNMTSMPHLTAMGWDYADRLQSADLGGGGDVYYAYDAGGDRVRKVIDNGNITEERIYLGDWEIYRRTDNSSLQTERETLHISDDTGRIASVDTLTVDSGSTVSTPTPVTRYQLSNHLGSASAELDASANILTYEEYHPFGSTSYRSENTSGDISLKRYRYVAKERDDETGLYYYGARYYAAWLARFVSVDPLKDDYPYYTSYQYAGNKPINFIDLDGLEEADPNDERFKKEKRASGSYNYETQMYTVGGSGGQKEDDFDTLYGIARRFEVSIDYLLEFNPELNANIKTGQELFIPTSGDYGIYWGYNSISPHSMERKVERFLLQDEIQDYFNNGNQVLKPGTSFMPISDSNSSKDVIRSGFRVGIASFERGFSYGKSDNSITLIMNDEINHPSAGKGAKMSSEGFGAITGLKLGSGTGTGYFIEELGPEDNPFEIFASATSYEFGIDPPIPWTRGVGGASINYVSGLKDGKEIFRMTYTQMTIGISVKKNPPISGQESTKTEIIQSQYVPSSDTLKYLKKNPLKAADYLKKIKGN